VGGADKNLYEKDRKDAYGLLGKLKKGGFKSAFIRKQNLAGRNLYRLRLGVYRDKSDAEKLSYRVSSSELLSGIKGRVTQQQAE